jgi:hypothetical protein
MVDMACGLPPETREETGETSVDRWNRVSSRIGGAIPTSSLLCRLRDEALLHLWNWLFSHRVG